MSNLNLSTDVLDVRDIIERVEELENEVVDTEAQGWDNRDEYGDLTAILEELRGYGGDEQWRGDWYPMTLIADSYFTEYCRELVSDVGDMPRNIPDYIEIDWEATAKNLKDDYSECEINGFTYFYR